MAGRRLRAAVVGLGDIAERVYLPLLALRPELELVLVTRDAAKLDRLAARYRPAESFTRVEEALAAGVDCALVHAATQAHPALVRACLEADVPVYVDKPLADTLAEAEALAALARARGVSLRVGFNRRFAPAYAELLDRPRELVLMQKNRVGSADEPRRVVFDDFVHVVDTLRFLSPAAPSRVEAGGRVEDGRLRHVWLHLVGQGWTAMGVMNRVSGANEEVVEVMGAGAKRRVLNLSDVVEQAGGVETVVRRGDWTPVARQRGIEGAVDRFLAALAAGERLDAADAVETHRLCELALEACG